VTLKALPTFRSEVSESVVSTLRKALEYAERGQLTDITVVGRCSDGNMYHSYSKAEHNFARIGHVAYALFSHCYQQMQEGGETLL
jgi:hypothetical protein